MQFGADIKIFVSNSFKLIISQRFFVFIEVTFIWQPHLVCIHFLTIVVHVIFKIWGCVEIFLILFQVFRIMIVIILSYHCLKLKYRFHSFVR